MSDDFTLDLLTVINDRQQITYDELLEVARSREVDENKLNSSLSELESSGAIASRKNGGILTYYILQQEEKLKKVLIVEDDKNINTLMALSIGKGFDVTQVYDGRDAIKKISEDKPDLVVLDLMLPGINGLDICQTIKRDQRLSSTIVIIVSAMDATSNRFKGIKYGADYYVKKPFDPSELRSLVTIFLKKKGKRFDPLIDLPNEERISNAVEQGIKQGGNYEIGKLKVTGIADFAKDFGNDAGITILRLVSQLLQDHVKGKENSVFVGFLNNDEFVIAGDSDAVRKTVKELSDDFNAVLPFIYQSEGYKPVELGIEDIYGAEKPRLDIAYSEISKNTIIEKRAEIIKSRHTGNIGSYTYEELRKMLGSNDLDIILTRDPTGDVKLSVGRWPDKKDDKGNDDRDEGEL